MELRYGIRMLLRSPGFTAAAILCLALGIGATTAIFSVVYSVVMKPLPYAAPDRLVRIYSEFPNFPGGLHKFWVSAPEMLDLKREARTSWESIDGWVNGGANLAGGAEPIRVTSSFISGGLMPALGVQPKMGRLIEPSDDTPTANLAVEISDGLWKRALGGAANILGREVMVNGRKATIIGVMPPGFQFPPGEIDAPEIWVPLQIDPARPGARSGHFLSLVGRLRPGMTPARGQDELTQLVNHWGRADSMNYHALSPKNHPLISSPMQEEVVSSVRPAMLMMLAAVGFVLLISCVNVANLLLARAEARHREVAIRKALGAGVWGLARQFIIEGTLLSFLGACAGLLLAFGGLKFIIATGGNSIPRAAEIAIDWRVLLFTLGISIGTGLFFGLAPMAQVIHENLNKALNAAASRTTASVETNRVRQVMVVAEVALALILLIGSGLMVRAFWKLQAVDTGLNARGLLTMRVALPTTLYADRTRLIQFWSAIQDRMSALPGVASMTMMSGMPPVRPVNANDTQIEGWVAKPKGPIQNTDYYQTVGKKYFETMGIRLIEGRYFDERDGDGGAPTVMINQTFARMYYPGQSALGHRLRPAFQDPWRTIVGVVADVKNAGIDQPTGTELYLPYQQDGGLRSAYMVLRTTRDPVSLIGPVRAGLARLDSSLPVANVRTMEDVILAAQSRPRFLTLLLSLFSGVALILAALGIYGVISYSVAQRTGEIGIRMALGARPGNVLGMVLGQGAMLGAAGVIAGALGALGLTRFIRGLLFGIDSFDPVTFVFMAALLISVTLLACYIPARRATKVDPLIALRYE